MKIKTQIIMLLIIYAVIITVGFIVLQLGLNKSSHDLNLCTDMYNELSLNYDWSKGFPTEFKCSNVSFKDGYYYCPIDNFIKVNKTQ